MAFSLGEYQEVFLEESADQLEELNNDLIALEKNPNDLDIINNIFRAAHSFKSSAAFVGLNDLSDLAHKMENLLQGLRDQTMKITPEITDVIFKCFDAIRSVIETVAEGNPPTQDLSGIKQRVVEVGQNQQASATAASKKESKPQPPPVEDVNVPKMVLTNEDMKLLKTEIGDGNRCFEITIFIEKAAQMKWLKAQLVLGNIEREGKVFKTFPSIGELIESGSESEFNALKFICTVPDPDRIHHLCDIDQIERVAAKEVKMTKQGDKISFKLDPFQLAEISKDGGDENEDEDESSDSQAENVTAVSRGTGGQDEREPEQQQESEHDHKKSALLKTVKVSIDKLDQLLNNVGELVIANSGFYRLYDEIRKYSDGNRLINEFKNRIEQMSRIAKDLQTGIMKTRMVPIGQVFSRFNRLVRDLAKESNKK